MKNSRCNTRFYCNGPITGYQVQSQIPVTGVSSPPEVTDLTKKILPDTFSCSGEVPGWAANCVGAAKQPYENITGQFAIGTKLCAEPRVDPLLTVTYAYLEKGVITQAISGPYDLGRPKSCKTDALLGLQPLQPQTAGHQEAGRRRSRRRRKRQRARRRARTGSGARERPWADRRRRRADARRRL